MQLNFEQDELVNKKKTLMNLFDGDSHHITLFEEKCWNECHSIKLCL